MKNGTWSWCNLPAISSKKAIGTKWAFLLECKPDGSIDCYKARLVEKGHAKEKGITFEETFAPTYCMIITQSMCALAAYITVGMYIN